MVEGSEREGTDEGAKQFSAPAISLPKGGGAIRGMGEKFAANPVTGTGSMFVPIATSPGRSGSGPEPALSYDSGSGNGPFGFGWTLALPAITRKTDKGVPRYLDAEESDVFLLSGAEDLVPEFKKDDDGGWILDDDGEHVIHDVPGTLDGVDYDHTVRRYRPRIEGLFARIERWTRSDGDVHWRSISRDNVLSIYGRDPDSRIAEPADPDAPDAPHRRIFSWLICETRDDKGNAIVYEYKPEDGVGVEIDRAHERNRGDPQRATNRYLKRICYGNRKPLLDENGKRPRDLTKEQIEDSDWMFEVVLDYGEGGHYEDLAVDPDRPASEHHRFVRASATGDGAWPTRPDPFSTYRAGFEIRTYRLCRRVLMFHHFENEEGVGNDCLVRSTDFTYSHEREPDAPEHDPERASNAVYTFLAAVTQSGYKRQNDAYLKRTLPPVEFEYSQPVVQDAVHDVDTESLENLPIGVDGAVYQWTDLHGEGIPGILTEQADAWFYKRNLTPINLDPGAASAHTESERAPVEFAPVERVAVKPNLAIAGGQAQFMDLAGDGRPNLVVFDGPMPGCYEHDGEEGWHPFRPFTSRLNRDTRDPNVKFVDLNGDGLADILITEGNAFVWHPSLGEDGFGPAERAAQALDEEKGARLVFADGTDSIFLADLSGDGPADLARIRNGEVCYWPNLGYGRFGAKITMDHAPWFDYPDQFDPKRIRLADIDGTGTTDIIYLHRDGVRLYFNQSGNSWSEPQVLSVSPRVDDLVGIVPTDLLGNGTACLVWSSPLPGDAGRQMRYIDLMGGRKPHVLVKTSNNLGAETHVHYAPSTKFYLQDKRDGRPWITRLPFPVHVIERVVTYDHIGRNRFVTCYAYHHGYFDGEEREFRGFGMVEQWDTEELAALTAKGALPETAHEDTKATNEDPASHVPPRRTRTWFHTGVYIGRKQVSRQYEIDYYHEPGLTDEFGDLLLPDTTLPPDLTLDEEREACRALKGMMLRQEVYADDASPESRDTIIERAKRPYSVVEQDFTVRLVQPRGGNRHALFFTHPREAITYHYERRLVPVLNGKIVDEATAAANPDIVEWRADPRIQHALTLEVDDFGNVRKETAVGYGRRWPDATLPTDADRKKQKQPFITYTENGFTTSYDTDEEAEAIDTEDDYRAPLPCETRTYELTGYDATGPDGRFQPSDFGNIDTSDPGGEIDYETPWLHGSVQQLDQPAGEQRRRLIEHVRTYYRPDDLGAAQGDPLALLPLGAMQALALAGETYKLAFTPGLLSDVYRRPLDTIQPPDAPEPDELLPAPAGVLALGPSGEAGDRGGYVDLDGDGRWWIPSGRLFFSPGIEDEPATERDDARKHFFLPHRFRDAFHTAEVGTETIVTYDDYDLLLLNTRDALDNLVTAGERLLNGEFDPSADAQVEPGNDYRVLQPRVVMDPNGNRTEALFDALGMMVATAVKGKPDTGRELAGDGSTKEDDDYAEGDSLDDFEPIDLTDDDLDTFYDAADPHTSAPDLLGGATTRIVYDLGRFERTRRDHPNDPTKWLPAYAATLARETHLSEPLPERGLKIQLSFSYSDGFGREIQKKVQAEPGPVVKGGPVASPRWVGSGWVIFNNKGKAVRQYEPYFSQLAENGYHFEFGVEAGVSPVLFYDPAERVVATLHPNGTYEKVVFDPWQQTTWDTNDTVLADPRTDPDVRGYTANYFAGLSESESPWQTWYEQRQGLAAGDPERITAEKAAAHAGTPTTAHLDALGRPFLTVAHNRVVFPGHELDGSEEKLHTRVELDIEGNERAVRDAVIQNADAMGRIVMLYDYDMLGNRIHQASMEAGERWTLNDVLGNPIRAWDSREHTFRTEHDPLRRSVRTFVRGADPDEPKKELLTDRQVYGEQHPEAVERNLCGRLYLHLDQAGAAATEEVDFKGNTTRSSRRIALAYRKAIDWGVVDEDHAALPTNPTTAVDPVTLQAALAPLLEPDSYTSLATYDALNRPVSLTTPHTAAMQPNIIRHEYNEANLLERVAANLRGEAVNEERVWTTFVANIDYDAKGQRTRLEYGNGVETTYRYDPLTYRLVHVLTRRDASRFPGDCPQQRPTGWPGCQVQNLHYTYDAAGNITHIRDDAQQTIYFRNRRVEPSSDYTYDALYRLIEATGREHLGQVGGQPIPHSYNDAGRARLVSADASRRFAASDGNAMGTYLERYIYDAVGNFESMHHKGSYPANPGWTRKYTYREPSQLEPSKKSNRLTETSMGSASETNGATTEAYSTEGDGYDAHGNMLRMPHLQPMEWDFRDQLHMTRRQKINDEDAEGVRRHGERTWYVYDSTGQRVRKVTELAGGAIKDERIYLGGFEIYRNYGSNARIRETLHVMDDHQRIALIDTRTEGIEPDVPPQLIRYQLGNHLGSVSLELDDQAHVISYEEYTPYGNTSYQAGGTLAEVSLKRYGYTGKERDEATGLYYHGARYFAPWLGRWTSPDPMGLVEGLSLFPYVQDNPIRLTDPSGGQAQDSAAELRGRVRRRIDAIKAQAIKIKGGLNENSRYWLTMILVKAGSDSNPKRALHQLGQLRKLLATPHVKPARGSADHPDEDIYADINATDRASDEEYTAWDVPNGNWESLKGESYVEGAVRNPTYDVDRTNLSERLVVRMKIRLIGPEAEVQEVKSHEDYIEKSIVGRGLSVDIEFVDRAGPDVFDVYADPTRTEQGHAENWANVERVWLGHEVLHLLGLEDRRNYIESDVQRSELTYETRLVNFYHHMRKPPDPEPNKPSYMGSPKDKNAPTLRDWEVCKIAQRELTCR